MSAADPKASADKSAPPAPRPSILGSTRVVPMLVTLLFVGAAAALGYAAWQYYMGSPWTRDGAVRAYVVKIAPQVAGEIVNLPVADNEFVRKGDLLMLIDPRNYAIAVRQAQAAVQQAKAAADNANAEMIRREKLNDVAVTMEERQTYISQAISAEATYQTALANLEQARVNYRRTQVRSPVDGYVTNLTAQLGDYADVGALQLSVVNSDSFWVDAYFEETALGRIQEGDAATIKLMGYSPLLKGRVQGLARGVNVANSQADASGLATVNPIFTFVRLAQRIPVRIHIDEVPEGVELVAGLTATVQVEPYKAPPLPAKGPKPAPGPVSEAAPGAASVSLAADVAPSPAAKADAGGLPVAAPPSPQAQAAASAASSDLGALAKQIADNPPSGAAPPAPGAEPGAEPPATGPTSAAAQSAEATAAADIKTLEQQIAQNPPAGAAQPGGGPSDGRIADADGMSPSEYLGQTFNIEGGSSVTPAPRPRSPDPLRRRARARWRHNYVGQ